MKNLFDETFTDGVDQTYLGADNISVGNLVVGTEYYIQVVGDTNWSLVGATSGVLLEKFTATATTSGSGLAIQAHGLYDRIAPLLNTNANNTTSSTRFPQWKPHATSVAVPAIQELKTFVNELAKFEPLYDTDTLTGTMSREEIYNNPLIIGTVVDNGGPPQLPDITFDLDPGGEPRNSMLPNAYEPAISYWTQNGLAPQLTTGDVVHFSNFNNGWADLNGTSAYAAVSNHPVYGSTAKSFSFFSDAGFNNAIFKRDRVNRFSNTATADYGDGTSAIEFNSGNTQFPYFSGERVLVATANGAPGSELENNRYYYKPDAANKLYDFTLFHDQALTQPVVFDNDVNQATRSDFHWENVLISDYDGNNVHSHYGHVGKFDFSEYDTVDFPFSNPQRINITNWPGQSTGDYWLLPVDGEDGKFFMLRDTTIGNAYGGFEEQMLVPWRVETQNSEFNLTISDYDADIDGNLMWEFDQGYVGDNLTICNGFARGAQSNWGGMNGYFKDNPEFTMFPIYEIEWNSEASKYWIYTYEGTYGGNYANDSNWSSTSKVNEGWFKNLAYNMLSDDGGVDIYKHYTTAYTDYDITQGIKQIPVNDPNDPDTYITLQNEFVGTWPTTETVVINNIETTLTDTGRTFCAKKVYVTDTNVRVTKTPIYDVLSQQYDWSVTMKTTGPQGLRDFANIWYEVSSNPTADNAYRRILGYGPYVFYDDVGPASGGPIAASNKHIQIYAGVREDASDPNIKYVGYIACDYDAWVNDHELTRITPAIGNKRTNWERATQGISTWSWDDLLSIPLEDDSRWGTRENANDNTSTLLDIGWTNTFAVPRYSKLTNKNILSIAHNYNKSTLSNSLILESDTPSTSFTESSLFKDIMAPFYDQRPLFNVTMIGDGLEGVRNEFEAPLRPMDRIAAPYTYNGQHRTWDHYVFRLTDVDVITNYQTPGKYTVYNSSPDATESNVLQLPHSTGTDFRSGLPHMNVFHMIHSSTDADGNPFADFGYFQFASEISDDVYSFNHYAPFAKINNTIGRTGAIASSNFREGDGTVIETTYFDNAEPTYEKTWAKKNSNYAPFTFDLIYDNTPLTKIELFNESAAVPLPTTGTITWQAPIVPPNYQLEDIEVIHTGNSTYSYQDTNNNTVASPEFTGFYEEFETPRRAMPANVANAITVTNDANGYITGATLSGTPASTAFAKEGKIAFTFGSPADTYVPPAADLIDAEDVFDTKDEWLSTGEDSKKVWPYDVWPMGVKVLLSQPSSATKSIGGIKYVRNSGFMRWQLEASYPPMAPDDFRKLWATAQAAKGQTIPFEFLLKDDTRSLSLFDYHVPGKTNIALIKEDVAVGDTTMVLEGFNEGDTIGTGELVKTQNHNGYINTVISDAEANKYGEIKVRLAYPVDVAQPQGTTVEFDPETAIVTLSEDSFEYTRDTAGYYYVTVTFDFDEWK